MTTSTLSMNEYTVLLCAFQNSSKTRKTKLLLFSNDNIYINTGALELWRGGKD